MSSETTEDEDNMILMVVEDEEHTKDEEANTQVPSPNIKVEPCDDSGDCENSGSEVFKMPVRLKKKELKPPEHSEFEEEEFDTEYLDENSIKEEPEDDEYVVEYLEDDEEFANIKDKSEPKYITTSGEKRKIVSLVKKLRRDCPELAGDNKRLVEHLTHIMRNTTPPKPPENFCKMIAEDKEDKVIYECSYCEKQTETLPEASRHYQFVHGEFYLTCLACGVKYRNTTNLLRHEKRCRAPDAKVVLQARGCYLGRKGRGRPYITNNKFIRINTPTEKKDKIRAASDSANNATKRPRGRPRGSATDRPITRPAKTNDKERLYCSMCPASFIHRENLDAHENSHLGVRPFLCTHCPAKYTSATGLRRHVRALHGDEKFICDICGNEYSLKPALISHLDSHRTIRKHPCLYCERRFAQKTALRHHTNKVHLKLPAAHGCPVCPKRYARMTHVRDHMMKAHNLNMVTRRMFLQSLPIMRELPEPLDAKVIYNNVETNETITPDLPERENLPDWPKEEYIEVDLKFLNQHGRSTDKLGDDSIKSYYILEDGEPIKIDVKKNESDSQTEDTPGSIQAPGHKKLTKKLTTQVKTVLGTELSVFDQKNDDDFELIIDTKSKREKKSFNIVSDHKLSDSNMDKVLRNIKSALKKRKPEVENPELDNSVPQKVENDIKKISDRKTLRKSVNKESDNQPIIFTLEKPKLVKGTDKQNEDNVEAGTKDQVKFKSRAHTEDEKDEEIIKQIREKDALIAEFFEYMKSGKVPKRKPQGV